jgi:hypothetical protein
MQFEAIGTSKPDFAYYGNHPTWLVTLAQTRLVLIVIDGCRPDYLDIAAIPNICLEIERLSERHVPHDHVVRVSHPIRSVGSLYVDVDECHALGRMRLHVQLVGADETVVDEKYRS